MIEKPGLVVLISDKGERERERLNGMQTHVASIRYRREVLMS